MGKNRKEMTERILNLTLEMICLLTGEDYPTVKKSFGECLKSSFHPRVSGGWSRTHSHIMEPPPRSLMYENTDERILERANKIIELLTREDEDLIDIKIEAISEEETYLTCDRPYMEREIPIDINTDISSNHDKAERFSIDPQSHKRLEENGRVPQNYQEEVLTNIKVENISVEDLQLNGYRQCKKEDIPEEIGSDVCAKSLEEQVVLLPDFEADDSEIIEDAPDNHNLSSDSCYHRDPFPDLSEVVNESVIHSKGKVFPCSFCGKFFKKTSSLSMHMRIHSEERPFSCLECGKCFTQNSILLEHQRIHTGEKPFSCSVCGKYFAQKSALVKHERSHTGEKPFACLDCWKCFTRKDHLERHQRIHRDERPFSCSECGKSFTRISVLVAHQRIHTGEKPYSCAKCGKCFTYKSVLIEHEKIHTGEKPFSCSDCGKSFAQKSTLVAHQRTHTGEKPFSCSECGKCFSIKSGLVRHQRTHTEEKTFPCSECGKCFNLKAEDLIHHRTYVGENGVKEQLVKCYLCMFLPKAI